MYRVWIGNRESEILTYNIFDESITFYGSNKTHNSAFSNKIRFPNNYKHDFKEFVIKKIKHIMTNHAEVEFHFYNPIFAHKILKVEPELEQYFVNINAYESLKWITSKTFVREWLSNSVSVPSYALLSKSECNLSCLNLLFPGFSEFVIQKDISGGGEGTYLLTTDSEKDVHTNLKIESLYLVSPYYTPKLSVCCHMLVGNENVAVFPFGIQRSEICNNKILYAGTCYQNTLQQIDELESELLANATSIGKRLQHLGYRGICGLDFIIYKNSSLFIEVNARYLGSTFLINKALKESNLPSVFELNSWCFSDEMQIPSHTIRNLTINYSSNTVKTQSHLCKDDISRLISQHQNRNSAMIFYDGLENIEKVKENTYLFREIC